MYTSVCSFLLFTIFLNEQFTKVQVDVTHLTFEDAKCFPTGFNYDYEEQEFVHLLVIPYLEIKSIEELSHLHIIPIDNSRYNDFLSCTWKNKRFQSYNGVINYEAIEKSLSASMARDVGDTGPGILLSKMEGSRIVTICKDLGGYSHGQRVVLVRNCILQELKKFIHQKNGQKYSRLPLF
ncbi:hypothetical protein RI129_002428 [Pyrocoelia pectoralis]|uniref:Uncharacterized protein n=1 Tax=Pyrocoelia pectoralis TaxID=417401 RepID=A0AAN7VLW7_9COLE